MKNTFKNTIAIVVLLLFTVVELVAQRDFTMQITVDKPVEAGKLMLFPGVKDADSYWYMSKTVRVARNDDGTPKFSLVKWVHNQDDGTDEGLGGAVFHSVFGYGPTSDEIKDAETALKRINSKGKIVGPVIFKGGTVTVSIPKINDPEQQEVVAIAAAPTIQGANIAVNLQLDKRSATLFWDSFNTPNPLVTFTFNMELAGYNSPMEAKITIHREQIHNHERMQAGVATPWLAAEVGVFLDEMIDNGAIEIEKIGENFEMQEAIDRAIEHATNEFFTSLGSSDGPNLSQLAGLNGQEPSYLDRASGVLNSSRREARSENNRIRSENRRENERVDRQNDRIRTENRRERERVDAENEANRTRIERENAANSEATSEDSDAETNESEESSTDGEDTGGSSTPTEAGVTPENVEQEVHIPREAEQREEVTAETREEEEVPSLAIVASFVKRTVKITGDKVISFKETLPTVVPMPFGGNLGVNRKDCESCFREINLDDPVFKQRPLLAIIDGFNLENFSEFINYASLQIKKPHESGETSYDEVRVTRDNFNEEGNLFTLMYGWKGDNDRSKWLDFEYKVGWSFFGGNEFETEWTPSNKNTINLSAPLQQKRITIEAERDLLEEANVRSIDVKIIYNLGGGDDLHKQFTINTSKDILNGQVEIMLPKNHQEYAYEITWRLWGGNEVSSGRKTTSSEVVHVDELPSN
ncbi:hypothetical protein [Maribacter sp. MAR_2009_72]|uniref:hypothetical protein n=1 Tax=Maribacter sp. MAR_2009_72 TaxID=1250050 RepID=UPI00119A1298|nr:hypothetical protein [Maribacter sp. MAR_2009_72]TVZ14875.1 hypothetical protein JM81_1088 [Maribacter sp. MAR_2009_72]